MRGATVDRSEVKTRIAVSIGPDVEDLRQRAARLSDAKFFWDQDLKRTLSGRVGELDKITFHAKLGTQGERVVRIEKRLIEKESGGTSSMPGVRGVLNKRELRDLVAFLANQKAAK